MTTRLCAHWQINRAGGRSACALGADVIRQFRTPVGWIRIDKILHPQQAVDDSVFSQPVLDIEVGTGGQHTLV